MTGTNVRQMQRGRLDSEADVAAELRHIRDLVVVREALARRGATRDELDQCDVVIDEVRVHLAELVKRTSTQYEPPVAA